MNQALALKPNGVSMCADAASLQEPMRTGAAQGVVFVGLHAAADPGPHPDIHLFANISQDPVAIGKATADWPIADSDGKARVVVITHNEYAIANRKSTATKEQIEACPGCKMLEVANFPASAASDRHAGADHELGAALRRAALRDLGRRQRLRLRRAVAARRRGEPDDVKLIGADGNRSAYERIRAGGQYQVVTVSEPFEQQAYQAIDEFNRAFHGEKRSGFVQPPFLVTAANVNAEGGEKNMFFPGNGYESTTSRSGAWPGSRTGGEPVGGALTPTLSHRWRGGRGSKNRVLAPSPDAGGRATVCLSHGTSRRWSTDTAGGETPDDGIKWCQFFLTVLAVNLSVQPWNRRSSPSAAGRVPRPARSSSS